MFRDPSSARPSRPPPSPSQRSATQQRRPLTFSVSRSFTVGKGVLVDILLRFDSAQRERERKKKPPNLGSRRAAAASVRPHRGDTDRAALPGLVLDPGPGPGRAPAGPGAHSLPAPAAAARSPAGAGRPVSVPAPQGAPRARAPSSPPPLPPVAPRSSAPGPPHRAAGRPKRGGGAGGCERDGPQDRPPRVAGADHGGSREGGAYNPAAFPSPARFPPKPPPCRPTLCRSPAPRSLTDPRWPPLCFLRCLRIPEVTTSPSPGVPPIGAAGESLPAAVARGDLVLSGRRGRCRELGRAGRVSSGSRGRRVPTVPRSLTSPTEPGNGPGRRPALLCWVGICRFQVWIGWITNEAPTVCKT